MCCRRWKERNFNQKNFPRAWVSSIYLCSFFPQRVIKHSQVWNIVTIVLLILEYANITPLQSYLNELPELHKQYWQWYVRKKSVSLINTSLASPMSQTNINEKGWSMSLQSGTNCIWFRKLNFYIVSFEGTIFIGNLQMTSLKKSRQSRIPSSESFTTSFPWIIFKKKTIEFSKKLLSSFEGGSLINYI